MTLLTPEELEDARRVEYSRAGHPDELTMESFLHMILQAHKPGKCGMSEYERAEICKILTEARHAREKEQTA